MSSLPNLTVHITGDRNMTAKFTVFCAEANGQGTVWIDAIEADGLEDAKAVGREKCANAWDCDIDDVDVIGVAEGDVNILFWEDGA